MRRIAPNSRKSPHQSSDFPHGLGTPRPPGYNRPPSRDRSTPRICWSDAMFDSLKNMNLGDLMQQAKQMQGKVQQMQAEMAKKTVTADAGAGMVQATVNGKMELTRLKIDKTKVDTNDTEMLEDVILAAVNAAQAKAGDMMKSEMQKMA